MLSSSTTIKALASAWHDLRTGYRWTKTDKRIVGTENSAEPWDKDRIIKVFAALPSMDAGNVKTLDPFWRGLNIIEAPYAAPTAGNIRIMSMAIVDLAMSHVG